MSAGPVARLVRNVDSSDRPLGAQVWTWCPGCDRLHPFTIETTSAALNGGVTWDWDGDLARPTFSPSMLVGPDSSGHGQCHSFVRAGRWEFLSDSDHHLAGQTVDMVPLPADWLANPEETP